ncbi:fibronectin type III domain-containing protein [Paenibacillus sp. sptzw28]|uniref:LamG-like jellyroll fold domain-containing protein n=1 Tax=Paenibacillus sp. sptzw28 TaxID=715179 RepID=UPI001C6F027A|nr:LamG-like jellyroll fold domain-containing protein [Paenibacillus sp. sptzw28]QYR22777.1 fibronectin type III domain-containing protein [Paenibacillus sp. sptzw28]
MLTTTTFFGLGSSDTAYAAISPLITSYQPQVVNTDVDVSYTDSSGNTISGTIHHPGIAMRQSDLDNMRDHVRAGDEPWNTAFSAFSSDSQASKTPRIYYEAGNDIFINIRGPWAETVNGVYYSNPSDYVGTRANTDSETAFIQAIMWYITGDETYRSNAMTIIRNYSAIQSCATHTSFRFATMTYLLAAAAEILRYSDTPTSSLDWTEADTTNLTNAMNIVTVTYNPHTFFMNQHQFTVMGTMGRAIFTNNLQLYAEAVEAATVNSAGQAGGRNGSIKYEMRYMTANEVTGAALSPSDYHVQLMEMGRDVGHSYGNVGGLSTLARTIYAQGTKVDPVSGAMSTAANAVNPFNFLDDRLLAGVTYLLKYHLGYDVLWTPAYSDGTTSGSAHYDAINADGRGRIDSYFNVLYNYYKYIEGRDMTQEKYKYLAYAYETRMPEVAAKDYPLATLLYTPDAAKTVGLSNQITLGGITGLTATASGSTTIDLSWTAVSGALGYNIYRSTAADGTFTKINSEPLTSVSYSDTGLTPNTIYYYQVGVAGGSTSSVVSATTGGTGVPALDASSYDLNVSHTHQTVLRVINADRSTQDLTSQASYASSSTAVATVNSAGLVTGISAGTATITATYNGQTYNAAVKVVPDTSQKTWYKFDETSGTTAADSSGYGNNGTVNGGSNATWATGKYGNAISFGGTNTTAAYVALPGNLVDNMNSMTFAAWVYCSNTADAVSLFTAGPAAAATPTKYMMMLLNGSRFTITASGNIAEQNISPSGNLTANTWKHIAVTLSGSTGILYIDGVQAATNTGMTVKPSDLAPTTSGNFIGKSAWTGDKYLKGQIDDFRIYNRALSASETTNVMNGQTLATVTTAPTAVTAAAADGSSVNLSWPAVTGATGYHVYVSDSLAVNAVYTKSNSDAISGTSYTSQGLKANKTYYFKVTAVNATGESAMSAIASAATGGIADTSLITWYKFNQTSGTAAADSSGYANNGILNGGAAWTTGQLGNAVDLDGTDDYASLPAGIVSGADTITVAAWVNLDTVSNWARIFDFGSGTSTYMFLTPSNGAGKIRFAIKNNGSSEQIIDGTSALAAGGWHHVAVTLNGATGILYVDGAEAGRNSAMTLKPSDMGATTQNRIGRSQYNDPYLNGLVDDFRIYTRHLTAGEIAALAVS